MAEIALFAIAFLASAAPPGPDTLTVFGRGLHGGTRSALPFAVGVLVAKLSLLGLAAFGIAEVAERFENLFVAVKFAGAAYLVVIGIRTLRKDDDVEADAVRPPSRYDAFIGFGLGVANPAAVVFYVALVPNVVDLDTINLGSYLVLAAILSLCWTGIALGYAGLAGRLRASMKSLVARRRIRRVSGATMIGAGLLAASR